MIPRTCKRLAEVDFPIAVVSKHAVRERPIVSRHPQSLHQWWARRPLASSRSVLLALLLPDPCDPACPEQFKQRSGEILSVVRQPPRGDAELRKALLWFIGAFANWDMAAYPIYMQVGRNLVQAAHGDEAPLVVDPFAGGGSIPLEALRLGCEAFASDLNPVACLILKALLEDIQRHGPKLSEELRRVGGEIKAMAEEEVADLYPPDPDGAMPIAYLWARTVRCEAPNCGMEIPLMRSFWLCRKAGRKRALRARVVPAGERSALATSAVDMAGGGGPLRRDAPGGGRGSAAHAPPRVEFEIFEPQADREVPSGTVTRARATCLCCPAVLPPARVRAQLAVQRGGADVIFDEHGCRVGGAFLLAVVTLKLGQKGRRYRLPVVDDYEAVRRAQERVAAILAEWEEGGRHGLCPVPDEPTPTGGGSGAGRAFGVQRYGMLQWGDLFTARQKIVLQGICKGHATLSKREEIFHEIAALTASRLSDRFASLVSWDVGGEKLGHVFSRPALSIVWDFVEGQPFAGATGSYQKITNQIEGAVRVVSAIGSSSGHVGVADAGSHPLPDQSAAVWFTDPPYYDAIPYSDLSDFFLVWLKRALWGHPLLRDPFDGDNSLSPKSREAVQDEARKVDGRPKDRAWFEETMARAFAEGRRVLGEDGVGSVVFAHKTTEGWEALLSGMIRGGWTIVASWPIATERPGRLRSRDSAALATSVHLVCRPRPEDSQVGDWAVVLRELPQRVGDWMERLQGEGIRGADLVFACVGPALEIFSRYRRVETADGQEVGLAEYLEKVWEVVGRTALENVLGAAEAKARNGLAGALEEDARLTALFLWTLQATTVEDTEETGGAEVASADDAGGGAEDAAAGNGSGKAKGFSLVFDVVRRFAQPLGIDLPKWEKRTIETNKGVVRLLPVAERARQLFGERGSQAVAAWLERGGTTSTDTLQGVLFPDQPDGGAVAVREQQPRFGEARDVSGERMASASGATTLDRVHTGMLLQAGGRTNALRALVQAEQERGPDFLRLSNALSALYPRGSEEKRLLDAMLLAVPR